MSDFEDRIGSAIEGLFAGAFRSPVQPAEIAKSLGRSMEKGRTVGVEKVYVPNLFTVVLSPQDDERFGGFLDTLAGELVTYLSAYADEHGYQVPTTPIVRFVVDPELRLGRFETYAELVSAEEIYEPLDDAQSRFVAGPAPERPHLADGTATATSAAAASAPADPLPPVASSAGGPPVETFATVTVSDTMHDVALKGERVVVGRLAGCDVCLEDKNVSREHAAFVAEGLGWAVHDLDSTNGTFVNGERVTRIRLRDGDEVQVGATRLVFHEPRR